ncbi:AAA family ATPase [Rhizobium helianthi]|uniref:AAA family ATPase n=1 Tax=Rhizobium helianthi TaxID=1132695 RepID=A0ABW4M8B4_9HYPH
MDRLSSFLLRHLAHVERRAVRRLAVRNGLLTMSTSIVDGHVVGRFRPAFDPSHLTGDAERDRQWVRDHLAAFLIEARQDDHGRPVLVTSVPAWPVHLARRSANEKNTDQARVAHAVRVVAEAGYKPSVKPMATLLLLAAAMEQSGVSLRDLGAVLRQPAPVFSVAVLADGFERALPQLIENTGIVPYGPYTGVAADFAFNDDLWRWVDSETRRVVLQVPAGQTNRPSRAALRGQLLRALADGTPVLAVSETHNGVPDQVDLTCDVRLTGAGIDRLLIADLLEAVYGSEAVMRHDSSIVRIDAGALTLDDLAIAIRPGRPILSSLDALAGLAALNREDKEDGNADKNAGASRRLITQSPSERRGQTSQDGGNRGDRTSSTSTSSKGKRKDSSRHKPTGAVVIQPEPDDDSSASTAHPGLRVESLTGYGAAKDWALGLKADLADYLGGELPWSDMSTKLLLSGPPGTGKTTFARALCNTLQVPLVVTSVSTWLQGEYLHDVLDRMANTFAEARTQAPCILFIDEIDGIGQRASASRPYADYWNACVNKVLELLDGAVKTDGVIVVGATNRPDQIDEAIRRSGRLETHIEIPRPDIPTLASILAHHLGSDLDAVTASDAQVGGQP